MKTKQEIKEWLLNNCVNEKGTLDLHNLDFSDFNGDINIGYMKVQKNLFQNGQQVQGDLWQSWQEVKGDLWQSGQYVQGDLWQSWQEVKGDLWQSGQRGQGDLHQDKVSA